MLPSGRRMRRSLHEQGHNTEDLRVVARSSRIDDAEQMVCILCLVYFTSRCAILFGAFRSLAKHQHPRPQ